ncbi:hypothetical protein TUBRATIS_21920 [Tubulinosema ratisbonensis]|uniref:Uncharacterized protein n=1 Tax=Tubulinosema ratisbonensis TaxID=291195 RepID=A0A437AJY3_9MICR|nr:hypothetical protein TUBRATIS_21920 [Tubulinosema ratisbonensis]
MLSWFCNFKNIFPTNSSVDFTLIRERINLFISHLYYINQNSQYLDLISRFNLVFNSEYYCIVSPVSVFRTNILEKLCNIYLDKFAFFEIFSLLSYIKKSFIPFESYKKIEGTIIFIILLNSFYSNYCEYYKNAIMKSHDFTSQESFDNFEGFKAIFNDKNGILKKSLHFPVNMILNSMYLSKIFFILLIFNLKLEYPHFLRCNMFLYVIHLKVFYFPDKDLSEIYNEISFEEKSFFWCFRY